MPKSTPLATHPCHIWQQSLAREDILDSLETAEIYCDEIHDYRSLRRCVDCGQLYFYAWWEAMRFDGEDLQDEVLIPVRNRAAALALSTQSKIMRGGLPTLVLIGPTIDAMPYWVNR